MFRVPHVLLWVVTFGWAATARSEIAESAEALAARAQELLLRASHGELQVYRREMSLFYRGSTNAPLDPTQWHVPETRYSRVIITWREGDLRVIAQREDERNGQLGPARISAFARLGGEGDGAALVMNQETKQPLRVVVPGALFLQEMRERTADTSRGDPVQEILIGRRGPGGAVQAAFGLTKLEDVKTEPRDGEVWRVLRGTRGPFEVHLWIDPEARVRRSVVMMRPPGMRRMIHSFVDTLYRHDAAKGVSDEDFDLEKGWAEMKPGISFAAGFSRLGEVLVWAGASDAENPGPTSPGLPPAVAERPVQPSVPPAAAAPTVPASPAPPSVAAAAEPAKPAVEEQLLNAEQMQAIVLIEGEDGVGSGFVARIREVDFVVTNQHVIGGNDKLRVTTLGGVPIKVGATFGAVSRDIALLRIEGAHAGPRLKLAEDPVKTVKLGDKVAVVGNRRGGGVATQVSGVVRGIGPDKVEVDAPFQPGNSGSPILHVASGEVIGLATYSQTRALDLLDGPAAGTAGAAAKGAEPNTEQRWFGYRADGVAKWEAIDLAKWRAQAKRISDFEADSEAIYHTMHGRFNQANGNPRVRVLIDRFEERVARGGNSQTLVMQEVHELFRGLRALAETGMKDLKEGEFYDYFRTSLYWETSIPEQLRAREELARRLDRASQNATAFLAKLRR